MHVPFRGTFRIGSQCLIFREGDLWPWKRLVLPGRRQLENDNAEDGEDYCGDIRGSDLKNLRAFRKTKPERADRQRKKEQCHGELEIGFFSIIRFSSFPSDLVFLSLASYAFLSSRS